MKIGVSLKIDVSKIDKARLFKGEKGIYLDATTFINLDELDQYGNNGFVSQDVSKEERDKGVQGTILGNVRVFYNDQAKQPQQGAPQPAQPAPAPVDDFDSDIPF